MMQKRLAGRQSQTQPHQECRFRRPALARSIIKTARGTDWDAYHGTQQQAAVAGSESPDLSTAAVTQSEGTVAFAAEPQPVAGAVATESVSTSTQPRIELQRPALARSIITTARQTDWDAFRAQQSSVTPDVPAPVAQSAALTEEPEPTSISRDLQVAAESSAALISTGLRRPTLARSIIKTARQTIGTHRYRNRC